MSSESPIYGKRYGDVMLTIFDGEQTADDVDRYLEKLDELHARDRTYLGVSLMLRYAAPRDQMMRIGRYIADNEETVARSCAGTAIITPHVGFRFLLSSLFMIRRMPNPYTVVSDPDAAFAWVRERGHGELLTPELERVVRDELARRAR